MDHALALRALFFWCNYGNKRRKTQWCEQKVVGFRNNYITLHISLHVDASLSIYLVLVFDLLQSIQQSAFYQIAFLFILVH